MNGRLYYELPDMNSGGGGGYICVDLRTGEEIWYRDFGSTVTEFNFGGRIYRFESSIVPAFGYLYDADYYNQHGVIPNGLLFTSGFGIAIDPVTAELKFNVTGVPSGTEMVGQNGEIYRLVLNSNGKWLAEWNSSKLWSYSTGVTPNIGSSGVVDASAESRYDWNATDLDLGPGSWSINRAKLGDIALLTQGSFGDRGNWYGANITAISLKPNSLGSILWTHQYDAAPGNVTRSIVAWDPDANVFVTQDKETMVFNGWSLTDGNHLWGPTEPTNDYTYFRQNTHVAYGKIYYAGYGGILYCYDITNGDLLWTYGNGGEGNSTNSALETAWGNYPEFVDVIADGKVYLATTEHSPNSPYYKDVKFRCVNATDGTEIWTLMGWGTGMDAAADVLADGFFVFLNCYDMQVYCVGKGPSAMTVEAPVASIVEGSSLVIRGTVTDIATGTQQKEQAARFPNGVPAVSDQSMGEWMEYVYMQKPRPTDTIGVNVTLSVIDSNGNYREIGTTTSDANGFFSYQWTPDIPGKYTVIASFAGSESYWPSQAETAFAVDPVPEITPGPTATPTSMSEMYFLPSVAGIIVAIAVVGALILLMLRRRP